MKEKEGQGRIGQQNIRESLTDTRRMTWRLGWQVSCRYTNSIYIK